MGKSQTAQAGEVLATSEHRDVTTATHTENISSAKSIPTPLDSDLLQTKKWNTRDGDAALALFENVDELHEPVTYEEERKLLRKIDFMILPYLAVCYAFFYVDKVFW